MKIFHIYQCFYVLPGDCFHGNSDLIFVEKSSTVAFDTKKYAKKRAFRDICQVAKLRKYIKLRKILHFFLKDMTLQGKNFATTGRKKYQVCYNIE